MILYKLIISKALHILQAIDSVTPDDVEIRVLKGFWSVCSESEELCFSYEFINMKDIVNCNWQHEEHFFSVLSFVPYFH